MPSFNSVNIPFLLYWKFVLSGHEVLYDVKLSPADVRSEDIAIVQFESRPLSDYWNASVHWNNAYAIKHGHQYILISIRKKSCKYANLILSPPWCKVLNITRIIN